jgi:alkylation response protein AidB-like acyl-CoA dehydrogenase
MEMELNDLQRSIHESVRLLLERRAGPERARELTDSGSVDRDLLSGLYESGFLDLFQDPDAGPLCAALVSEWVSVAAGLAPIGWRTLVAPSILTGEIPLSIVFAEKGQTGPVRFANDADALIVLDGDDAHLYERGEFTSESVRSIYGYPMATVTAMGGRSLESGAGAVARRWWRVALAAEIAGTSEAVFNFMRQFLGEREQFGRPLDTFQALQHRMIEAYVHVEATKWSAREAAYLGAPAEQSATAAITAVQTAKLVLNEAHQLAGAIGLTFEFDLHLWSLRLQTLRVEAGGAASHRSALVESRWG